MTTTAQRWFHMVFNFIGSADGRGIHIYHDGVLVVSDTSKSAGRFFPEDRNIVLGRLFVNYNEEYSTAHFDDVLFFNQALTEGQINRLNL